MQNNGTVVDREKVKDEISISPQCFIQPHVKCTFSQSQRTYYKSCLAVFFLSFSFLSFSFFFFFFLSFFFLPNIYLVFQYIMTLFSQPPDFSTRMESCCITTISFVVWTTSTSLTPRGCVTWSLLSWLCERGTRSLSMASWRLLTSKWC